ncbi:UNVERIFIED_CONTAM: hypothetical protein Sradi_0564900 [Sesamum radiatum]|uniref:Uncharacterized protein n=1 Tax=Sesamum radiatum TaxID=300843 RepID=A0AAW2VK57_SESRA
MTFSVKKVVTAFDIYGSPLKHFLFFLSSSSSKKFVSALAVILPPLFSQFISLGYHKDWDHCFMDKKEPGKDTAEDVTRESLIAISNRVPDKDLTAEKSPKNTDGQKVIEPLDSDGDEKYRSKLISISDSSSPDVKVQPVLPGQPDS